MLVIHVIFIGKVWIEQLYYVVFFYVKVLVYAKAFLVVVVVVFGAVVVSFLDLNFFDFIFAFFAKDRCSIVIFEGGFELKVAEFVTEIVIFFVKNMELNVNHWIQVFLESFRLENLDFWFFWRLNFDMQMDLDVNKNESDGFDFSIFVMFDKMEHTLQIV